MSDDLKLLIEEFNATPLHSDEYQGVEDLQLSLHKLRRRIWLAPNADYHVLKYYGGADFHLKRAYMLPLWNFLVMKGVHDKDQYFLDKLCGEFYSDTIATVSDVAIEPPVKRAGIVRARHFFWLQHIQDYYKRDRYYITAISLDDANYNLNPQTTENHQ